MKILPSKILFDKAYGKFCIPAINVSNPEQVIALFKVAEKLQAPFIIQTTPAAREYIPPKNFKLNPDGKFVPKNNELKRVGGSFLKVKKINI